MIPPPAGTVVGSSSPRGSSCRRPCRSRRASPSSSPVLVDPGLERHRRREMQRGRVGHRHAALVPLKLSALPYLPGRPGRVRRPCRCCRCPMRRRPSLPDALVEGVRRDGRRPARAGGRRGCRGRSSRRGSRRRRSRARGSCSSWSARAPVSLKVVPVPVGVAIWAKFEQPAPWQRSMWYPVTPTLSVAALQLRSIAAAARPRSRSASPVRSAACVSGAAGVVAVAMGE